VDEPRIDKISVLVKVSACAICGTDVKAYTIGISSIKPPVIIGHEFVGRIEQVGSRVRQFQPGDRVTMATTIPCGHCRMCRNNLFNLCLNKLPLGTHINGAFAEYVAIPGRALQHGSLMKVPDTLPDSAACLCEPLGCVVNGQNQARVGFPDTVVVIGGGPLGLLNIEAARGRGALRTILVGRSSKRHHLASTFSIDHRICTQQENALEAVKEITSGEGSDVVINAAPSKKAVELAFALVGKAGRVSLFASVPKDDPSLPIDINRIHYNQISVYGASDSTPQDHARAIKLLASGKINTESITTHHFPLQDFHHGINAIKNRDALKVIIHPE
jgi:L-iditol 2-dehydrogenase